MTEGRRSPRVSYDRAVRVRCSTWGDFERLYATNLSRKGIFLASDNPAPVLTPVHIELALPDGRSLALHGRVAHVVTKARSIELGKTAGMGVELTNVDSATAKTLKGLVDQLESGKPLAQAPRVQSQGDELSALKRKLQQLKGRPPREILDVADDADDAQILAQFQALSAPYEPARFAGRSVELRSIAAEIAIELRRALDALSQRQTPSKVSRPVQPPPSAPEPEAPKKSTGSLSQSQLFGDIHLSEFVPAVKPLEGAVTTSAYVRSPQEWHRIGSSLLRAQRFREAKDMLQRALEGDPQNRQIQRDFGLANAFDMRAQMRFDEAGEQLAKVLTVDPSCREASLELQALVEQRKIKKTPMITRALGG